ncbi:membrane protein [Beggiatoa sp. PS]|nr:membrane protein [Beggiatoa sp. PS]
MKFCPGIWCPRIIVFASLSLVFPVCGFPLVFYSINWFFDIQVIDIDIKVADEPDVIADATDATTAHKVDTISIDHIDKSNEGKIVHLTGNTTTDYVVYDFLFGLELSDVIKLKRVVEKFNGQNWANTTSPINSEIFRAKLVKLGAFTLSSGLIDETFTFKKLPITQELFAQISDNLSIELGGELHLNDGHYFVGQNPAFPQVGDLRIRFFVVSTGTVSITAKQVGSRLVYDYQSTKEIQSTQEIQSTKEIIFTYFQNTKKIIFTFLKKINLVDTYYFSKFYQTLPLYFLSFFTLSLGIYLIFLTLRILNYFPPLFDSEKYSDLYFKVIKFIYIGYYWVVIFLMFMLLGAGEGGGSKIIILAFLLFVAMITAPIIIYVIGLLLSKLLKSIPFFDNFLNWLNWLSAIIIAISLSFIFIAITWINYLPILSVTLSIIAIGNLYFLIPAYRLLIGPNYEPPELPLIQETVIPQKASSMLLS